MLEVHTDISEWVHYELLRHSIAKWVQIIRPLANQIISQPALSKLFHAVAIRREQYFSLCTVDHCIAEHPGTNQMQKNLQGFIQDFPPPPPQVYRGPDNAWLYRHYWTTIKYLDNAH